MTKKHAFKLYSRVKVMINKYTIYILSIRAPQLLNTFVLNFEQVQVITRYCVKIVGWVANNVDLDETPRFAASHLGLHCLLRSVLCVLRF